MKKVISLVLSLVMLLSITAGIDLSAYANLVNLDYGSGYCGEVVYTFDKNIGSLTISGEGEIPNYAFYQLSDIKSLIINDGVTGIGDSAFSQCDELKEITIPKSVTTIHSNAFFSVHSENVYYVGSVSDWCNISFEGVESYPNYWANNFYIQGSLKFFDNIKTIDEYAFCHCKSLSDVVIPYGVTAIGNRAFYGCGNLTSVSISNSVTSIGDSAFSGCGNLTSVSIPNSVTIIEDGAFYGCGNLASISIPNSVTTIGSRAFENCDSLTSVSIPDSVTTIGSRAFGKCTNLESIRISKNITCIASLLFIDCWSLTTFIIPDGVTSIGNSAFGNCVCLKSIVIPNGVTSIGNYAFENCRNLESVTISESVKSISAGAFYHCNKLYDSVYYTGNEQSWKNISIGSGNDYVSVKGTRIHYNVTDVHEYKLAEILEPTCLTEGYKLYRCPCGYDKREVLNSLGHSYETVEVIAPTCLEKGYTIKRCTVCSYEMKSDYKSALGHNYELVETKEPTCVAEGYELYRCSCGLEIKETVAVLEHKYELIKTVNSTCLTEGYKQYKCSCGDEKTEIISYAEHNFANGVCKDCAVLKSDFVESKHPYTNNLDQSWIISKPNAKFIRITFSADTFTESKYDYIYIYDKNDALIGCYSGSELASKSITVNGDTIEIRLVTDDGTTKYGFALSNVQVYYDCSHTKGALVKTIAPTCTKNGYSLYNCSICDEQYKTDTIKAVGHSYDNGKITKKATCKVTGVKTYTCKSCGATKTATIAKTGHTYKNVVTKATLSKNGKIENKCSVCGKVAKTTNVYYPKTIKLNKNTFTTNGKVQKPVVTVKDSKGNTLKLNKDYTVSYSNANSKNVGRYTVTVKMKGNYSGSKTFAYYINPKPVEFLASNKGGFKAISKGFTLKWNKQNNQTTGYQIQYSTRKDFKNAATVTIANPNTTSTTIKGRAGNTRYYVRIRTYKKIGNGTFYSGWNSGTKSVVTLR